MKKGLTILAFGVFLIAAFFYWAVSTGPPIENQRGVIVGDGPVLAAADAATFAQLGSVTPAQLVQWQGEGKVFLVQPGTSVLVVAVDVPRSHVRLLSGEFNGEDVHVLTTAVGRPQ